MARYIGTLDAKPEDQSSEKLLPYATGMTYAPPTGAGPGRLLYVQEGNLIAQPFDAGRRVIVGEGVTVAEGVGVYLDGALFSATNNILVYRTADPEFPITWFDRQGNVAGRISAPGRYSTVALSPSGTHAVAPLTNPRDSGNSDLWLFDLVRGGNPARLTYFPAMRADFPLWSFDGKQVLFRFPGSAGLSIFRKDIQSSQDPASVLESPTGLMTPTSWSPDGRFLMYAHTSGPTLWDLFVVALDGSRLQQEALRVPFAPTRFNEEDGRFSPDGEWVAYVSNESGANEVYVRRFNRALTNGSASVGTSVVGFAGGRIVTALAARRQGTLLSRARWQDDVGRGRRWDPNCTRRRRSRCFKDRPTSPSAMRRPTANGSCSSNVARRRSRWYSTG